jgi:hypothetical protein
VGEFVPAGAALFVVHGDHSKLDETTLPQGLILKLEPTLRQPYALSFCLEGEKGGRLARYETEQSARLAAVLALFAAAFVGTSRIDQGARRRRAR